jgi:hypothetical protein
MNEMAEKKDEQNKGKYTELELKNRGVGKFHATQTREWDVKLSTYHDEEVKRVFVSLKASVRLLCTDAEDYHYIEIAHKVAQIIIDKFLLQRSRGQDVPKSTAAKADFSKWDGKIDTISDINWIYNHLMIADVKPSDAPSPGAWAHLQYHRSTPAAMDEFFTKVYPRLIPSKGAIQKMQDLFHDDGRTTFDLLDRLLAECCDSSEQVPDIPMVLPEHPRLQNQAGKPTVPQEGP